MRKELVLQLDPSFTYSLNAQMKEQLKWLIATGAIQPGELLPPAGQLADTLNVNRNTVNLVYTQLRDEGIVSIKKGRGTQVLEGPAIEALRKQRMSLYELLTRTIGEAQTNGVKLSELVTSVFAYVQLFHQATAQSMRILFIECRGHDHPFYRAQVEQVTNAEVVTLFLDEIASDPKKLDEAATQADVVVTTLNHAEEVKALLSGKPIRLVTIGASADMATLMEIARIAEGSKVAFVCLGNEGGRWMAERVRDAGIEHIESIVAGIDNREALLNTIHMSDRVYASSAAYDYIKSIASDKAVLYPLVLERSSKQLLQEITE